MERILLIGNGGREHALAWKLAQSPRVEEILVCPGNGGTATCHPKVRNVHENYSPDDYPALVALARYHSLTLVIPGPEQPLVDGVEGYFRESGIKVFGPTKEAARMEGSKTYSKDFMKRWNIPTAEYGNFNNYEEAKKYLEGVDHNVVIKASGLAAGKGVVIPQNKEEALKALEEIMVKKEFGDAGDEVVIEEFLEGDELSILSFSDGYTIRSLPPAQDHKRIFDGDQGPNTGGMGCYAPTNIATKSLIEEVERTILQPTIDGMRKDRTPFKGMLFTGLMITKNGPKVLEYNVRFGDPETQTVLPLLSSKTDLAEVMVACCEGWLDSVSLTIEPKYSATVVIAAGGYPGSYAKGTPMTVGAPIEGANIFHAGTKLKDDQLQTSGGRVIASCATADTLEAAVDKAYEGIKQIKFEGMFYRKDIAHRALNPTQATKQALTYAAAGVSIDAGNEFVERIKKAVASTRRPGADAEIGGFGGELNLGEAGYDKVPITVAAIDGVGTKLMIAQSLGKHDTVGIDLVAMNVNDLVVQGAQPLMFLDYYGCSRLKLETAAAFVEGVAAGCRDADCALVGGETAEMPGLYQGDDYDAAGAAFGAMNPENRLPRKHDMEDGDCLVGMLSNGVHSNGFSLVRKIVEREGLSYTDTAPWNPSTTVGLDLLTPTKIYVRALMPVIWKGLIKGLAHITGGGLTENIPRMLPPHLAAEVDIATWKLPPVFQWLKQAGSISSVEMARTFNSGVGMVAVVKGEDVAQVVSQLEASGVVTMSIGKLYSRSTGACTFKNLESWD